MNINTSRGRSFSLSKRNLRELSTHSKTSSIPYYERMEIQNFNTFQSKQIKNNEKERLSLLYITFRVEGNTVNKAINTSPNKGVLQNNNERPALNNLLCSQGGDKINNATNICNSQKFVNVPILYNINQLVKLNAWDGEAYLISIFGTIEFLEIDFKNISTLLLHITNFIRNRDVESNKVNNVNQLQGFGQAVWEFISSIYKSGWDTLTTNKNNRMIRQNIVSKISPKINSIKFIKRAKQSKDKQVEVVKLPSSILVRPSKKVLEKSKFFNKRGKKANKSEKPKKSYM